MKIPALLAVLTQCLSLQLPQTWQENWYEHDRLLTLRHASPEIAVYFDDDVDRNATWMNDFLRDVWNYTKKTYGSFGPDPALYAIFHAGKYQGAHVASYFDEKKGFRNVVDLGLLPGDAWKFGNESELDYVVGVVGLLVQFANNGVQNSPAYPIWTGKFGGIFTYDVYLGIGRSKDAERFFKVMVRDNFFKNWFFPIYNKYGGSEVLGEFFRLLSRYFPKDGKKYARNMNFGEFIHFWSAACGKDLKDLAKKAFGWDDSRDFEVEEAKQIFAEIKDLYEPPESWQENWGDHKQLLTRRYYDNEVAIYFDPDVDRSIIWMNKYLHDVWIYTKKNYGNFFGDDPHLYAIFHAGKHRVSTPAHYFDEFKSYRNVIDCGKLEKSAWKSGTGNDLDVVTHEISHIVEGASHEVHESPAFPIWGDSKWAEIFIYDIYTALNLENEAQRWRQMQLNNHDNFPKNNTYWFRDWFLPIYEKYGGATVLNRFFGLLAQHFPKCNCSSFSRSKYTRRMNHGEFVYFWSAAVGSDLKDSATKAFGWNEQWEKEFEKAKKEFPSIQY